MRNLMFSPRKCGVKFDPPTLVVYYEENLTGKLHKRSMPVRKLKENSSITDILDDLKKSSHHGKYLENIPQQQLEKLLRLIQDKMKGTNSRHAKDSASPLNFSTNDRDDLQEDFNKLDDFELDKKKAEMDKDFEKNRIRPGDRDFVYDREVEFDQAKMESGWDDDDDYSDPEF